MDFMKNWNKIVDLVEKYRFDKEEKIQLLWEDTVFGTILDYGENRVQSQVPLKMGSTSKEMDIVIKNGVTYEIVIELKRNNFMLMRDGESQLFSYLNQLKNVKIGILVCDKLYVYFYNASQTDEENKRKRLEIPFEKDSELGVKFVKVFCKENFGVQNVIEFVEKNLKNENAISEIRADLQKLSILEIVKEHYAQKYSTEEIECALEGLNFDFTISANSVENKSVVNLQQTSAKNSHVGKTVTIKGHEFDLYMNDDAGDKIFQDFVRRTLQKLFEYRLMPDMEIKRLQDRDYSNRTFGLNYALLEKEHRNCFDNTGKSRYWTSPGSKIAGFYVCSQWWKEKVVPIYEDKFAEWVQHLARICNSPAK